MRLTKRNIIGTRQTGGIMDTLVRKMIDALQQPDCGQPVISIGNECFGLKDGTVINWRGQNYTPQRPSLRVWFHNWLVKIECKRLGVGDDFAGRSLT